MSRAAGGVEKSSAIIILQRQSIIPAYVQITPLDWAVVALYFLFNLGVGLYYRSRARVQRRRILPLRAATFRGGWRGRPWSRPRSPRTRLWR